MDVPGTSGVKRSLPTDELCYSKRPHREIHLRDQNNLALIENLIAEDSSGSEVDDVVADFISEISNHDTDSDTGISDVEATTQPLPLMENIFKS
ncbi:hypothetical protein HHI36_012820 [Cryptolaemus montrouzieri]|uniref:Uncharacterized protein n=1 Tax=Cryptolaemus montrouzieri TaxID=559131 RepID=A0ABD2NG71_9CUCU